MPASHPPAPGAVELPAALPSSRRVAIVLSVGVLAVSTAGTLVRLAPDAHPLAIAFWRVLAVAVLLAPWSRRVGRREAWLTLLGGLFLALHFWTWFESLRLTSVMRSTLLVCLTPVWAGVIEAFVFGEPPPRRFWVGIAVALGGVGALILSGGGGDAPGGGLAGDGLALAGGVLGASYFTLGRRIRATVPITTYGPLSCAATALWLGLLALLTDAPLVGFEAGSWLAILGLALGPQLLGHVGFNYAVGRLPAAIVAGVILLEPVGATGVAWFVLREAPSTGEIAGGVVTILGVGLAVLPARR